MLLESPVQSFLLRPSPLHPPQTRYLLFLPWLKTHSLFRRLWNLPLQPLPARHPDRRQRDPEQRTFDMHRYLRQWFHRAEQQMLRKQYLAAIRGSIRSQLNNIDMEMEDGTIVNLGEKYGSRHSKQ